jgi:hypothetical protein
MIDVDQFTQSIVVWATVSGTPNVFTLFEKAADIDGYQDWRLKWQINIGPSY